MTVNEFDQENYPVLKVALNLRRRSLFYVFNLFVPALFLSILSLAGFMLPAKSGEKIVLEISVFLAIIFFADQVSKIVPESSKALSRLSSYFGKRNL